MKVGILERLQAFDPGLVRTRRGGPAVCAEPLPITLFGAGACFQSALLAPDPQRTARFRPLCWAAAFSAVADAWPQIPQHGPGRRTARRRPDLWISLARIDVRRALALSLVSRNAVRRPDGVPSPRRAAGDPSPKRNFRSEAVSGASSHVATKYRSGSANLWIVRSANRIWRKSEPVV